MLRGQATAYPGMMASEKGQNGRKMSDAAGSGRATATGSRTSGADGGGASGFVRSGTAETGKTGETCQLFVKHLFHE